MTSRSPQVESLEDRRLLAVVTQPLTGTETQIVADGDQYFDSGNIEADYSNLENGVLTLDSQFPSTLEVDFTAFSTAQTEEIEVDTLEIFDGADTSSVSLGVFSGTNSPGTVTGSGNALTFRFTSDEALTDFGWEAAINVTPGDLDLSGTSSGNSFEIRINPTDPDLLDVVIDGNTTSFALAAIAALTISGGDGDDSLDVDFTNGNPIPAGGLTFNGQGQDLAADGDVLSIINPVEFGLQELNYTTTSADGNDGNIVVNGMSTITYTGLEPINAGNAADTILNLPIAFTNDAILQNNTTDGSIEIIDNGLGGTFEDTVIPNPSNSLTVNLGDQGDDLQVNPLDAAYAASLIINGGSGSDDVDLDDVDLINTPGRGLTVTGTEQVDITDGTISGNTAVNGGGIYIEDVNPDPNTAQTVLRINRTAITDNVATGTLTGEGGGGIFNEGASLTLNEVTITRNMATGTSGSGGGILNNAGIVNVTGGSISDNSANRAGGGIEDRGGATGTTTVTLLNVTLDGNDATGGGNGPGNGGGLHVSQSGDISITGGTVDGNSAALEGGGLWNGGGIMTIDGTTIDGNTASGDGADDGGGGIFNNGGTVSLVNGVDITDNVADGVLGSGGGILNLGTLTLDTTGIEITGNVAERAGGGIEHASSASLTLSNVTLDDNDALGTATNSPGNGGGLHVTGSANINVIGGTVDGNSAALEGGGLWNGGGTMTIDGTTIDGNTASGDAADDGGGGIFNNGGTLITNSTVTISNNVADGASGSGGGILNAVGGTLSVIGTTIESNSASRAGGGVEDQSGAATSVALINASLLTNTTGPSPGNGGGLHVSGDGNVSISGGVVRGNVASQEGGGLWNNTGTMTINGVLIESNTANSQNNGGNDQGGGGVFNNGGTLDIDNATITGNTADVNLGNGGGVMTVGGTVTIDGSTISGNTVARAGGGIENKDGTVTLTDVTLNGNTADINGGGLHVSDNGTTNVTRGFVLDNRAGQEGGGLWNSTGVMTIDGVLIQGNVADSGNNGSSDQGGGGVFNNGGTIDIDNSSIVGNSANVNRGSGGGILNFGGVVTLDTSVVIGNVADRAGGGIEDNGGTRFDITDVTIANNDAGANPGNGGGIHITGAGNVNIDVSTIEGNTSVEGGGIWNSGSGIYSLTNSTISGNTATGSDGGGVFNTSGGVINTDSVTITLNVAATGIGSGVAGGVGGTVTLGNTIVAQNPGSGVEENLSGEISSTDYNLIGDADDGTLTGLIRNTIFGADALLLPLSNNGGNTDTHLPGSGSPAIGFGDTALVDDQRGVLRPQGGQDDIGAVEVDLDGFVVDADDLAPGTAGDGNPDEFLIRNDTRGLDGFVEVLINSRLVHQFPKATTGLIVVRGSADDDTLTVDNSNGLVGAKIIFDGDGSNGSPTFPTAGGFDLLRLIGSTHVDTTYNPGETADAGAVFQEENQIVQRVEFFGLEPLQVLAPVGGNNILNVASAPLGVGFPQALNAANSINYSEGPNSNDPADVVFAGALTGLITVDGFESLEFANFEVLNINAGAGSDEINLNNPVTATELGTINVDGGDPTGGSDIVVVNGTAANETVTIDQLTNDGARISGLGPVITLTTTEDLLYDSQGGTDELTVTTPAGLHQIQTLAGATPGSGSVVIHDPAAAGELIGIAFENLDAGTNNSTLTLSDAAADDSDDLVYRGTDSGDNIVVTTAGLITNTEPAAVGSAPQFVEVATPGIRNVSLIGLGGDDDFSVPGDQPFDNLLVDGGTPSIGSDSLTFTGSGTGAVTLNLANETITEAGNGPVSYSGIEDLTIVANNTLTVTGTAGNDAYDVTPTTANAATFTHNGSPTVNFSYSAATTATFDGGSGGVDDLNVLGDNAADTITSAASAITVDASTVTLGAGLDAVTVSGLAGNDTINLGALVFAGTITILGGDGNDTLTGSAQADNIFGGSGNDTLIGGAGDDFQYGEDGNDVFGNPNLTADGTADDPGADQNFGGNGFDNFVWEPGDGTDFNQGGDDAADIFRFFGSAAGGETFTLRSGGTPTHFNALFGAAIIDNHGVEDVRLDPLGGNDTVTVNDLFATEVVNVTILAGGGDESVTVNARTTDDAIQVTSAGGNVDVEGLTYDVSINGPGTADNLTVNGGVGNDSVDVATGVEALITTTINGDSGDDTLSGAFNTANGGAGNDTISGAAVPATQVLNGGAGDDTFLLTQFNIGGDDTLTGGADADRVLIQGGLGADDIDVTATTIDINTTGPTTVNAASSGIELLQIEAGDGNNDIDVTGTPAGGYSSIEINTGDGTDDVDLAAAVTIGATIRVGSGNDSVTGGAGNDTVFGGAGDDVLIGGAGDDTQHGELGNDTFGNPNLVADGTADDPGADRNFGGNGFDNFVWEPGDGTDFNQGGDDAADIFRFFGSAAGGETFTLQSGGTPTHFNALFGAAVIDNHGVEDVRLDPLGGNDTVTINDLFATEVVNVTVVAGGGDETITVNARTTDDDIQVTAPAADSVAIEGLTYDVNVGTSATGDSLTINGGEGDDSIAVADGVEAAITTTINGGAGDDSLSGAFNTANGGVGDDTIVGSGVPATQALNGGAGEDTFVGGGGADTIDGGDDFDTILIAGTSGADVIDVFQAAPTTLNHTVNGDAQVDTLVLNAGVRTVEEALIDAGDGGDLVRVNWLDAHGVNANVDSLRMTVEGGDDTTSDRLVVVDDGTDDLVLYRKGQSNDSGTVQVGPGNAEPLLNVFAGIEYVDFVDETGAAIDNSGGSELVVFKHDPFETNNDQFTATYVGSGAALNVDPTIDPGPVTDPFGDGQNLAGDNDFYRVVAETTGTLDFQVYFRQVDALASGRPGLPNDGNLDINVLDEAGNIITGFGANDATDDERVRIPAVEGETYYLQVFGNGNAINVYNISVINHAPPVPYALELLDNPADGTTNPPGTSTNSDTGRSQFDNITYDTTPTLFFRLDDGIFLHDLPGNPADGTPPDEVIAIPFQAGVAQPATAGYAIAIFDEGNTTPQTGTAPQTPLGFATAVAGQEGVYTFTVPAAVALSEGSHFLSARVQMIDPATPLATGFGGRSDTLEIIVDTTAPEAFFGLAGEASDGLHPDSDSGTIADGITNDLTPTFFGRAEANSITRLYVDLDNSGTLNAGDLLIGQTTTIPLDGTDQLETPLLPNEPGGQWELTSTVSMNDPRITAVLGVDGVRQIILSAEDVAGNITDPNNVQTLQIFIDTQGPQVTDVYITPFPGFNLFDLKPDTPEPTPAVNSLTIELQDLPARVAPFLYGVLANTIPPLSPIVLVGDHSGPIAIDNVTFTNTNIGPGIATGEIVLEFNNPLPDDRYTLKLTDNLVDPAGNALDGENNAAEPIGTPDFPTGDDIPGGDFLARFTVDSRPEIATWSQGVIYADINGNFVYDPEGQDNDATNRDFVFNFGEVTDAYFAGNFSDTADSSGFDKPGAYGRFNGVYQFFLDTDDDGVGDLVPNMAFQVNAIPVAGNFAGPEGDSVPANERPRDEIGAYDGQFWYLDTNGNNQIDNNERFATNLRGIPFVGDFNGDGYDDLATFNNDSGQFQFDLDRNGTVDDTITFGFPGFAEKPVAGDFNLDGIDDIGLWVPTQEGQLPKEAGEFHFLLSDRDPIGGATSSPVTGTGPSGIFDPFSPAPLGNDLFAQFGDGFALPLVGNFDPPVTGGSGNPVVGSLTNLLNRFDTNRDGNVTALDALVVINAMSREGFDELDLDTPLRAIAAFGGKQLDASGDGSISAIDALQVINELTRQATSANGEQVSWAESADSVWGDTDDDDDDLLLILASDMEQQRFKS